MAETLQEFLSKLQKNPERYQSLIGSGDANALQYGFKGKRAVHPGMNSKPVAPSQTQGLWQKLMAGEASSGRKRMAYIHIPFCSHICLYCGFFQNHTNEARENEYVEHLLQEIAWAKHDNMVQAKPIQCVFFGGGTPSALSPENISRVLQKLRECLPLSNDCEITMEARVNEIDKERIEAWFNNGVNRVSLGVQSFDTKIRQACGRLDTQETVIDRLKLLTSYDQASVIVDIIFGLPGQTTESFIHDLEIIDSLPISGMDLYQLNLFGNSPMAKAIENGKLPKAATRAEQSLMFKAAEEWLQARAYKRLSNCHWSKDIRERSMYNILAKTGADVFPFGCGAGGFIGDYSVMQHRDLKKYNASIDAGEKPIMFMGGKSPFERIHNAISQNMEQGYFNLAALVKENNPDLKQMEALLDIWCQNGLMTKGEALYWQTQAGRFWQNNLTQTLIECAEMILAKQQVKPVHGEMGMPGISHAIKLDKEKQAIIEEMRKNGTMPEGMRQALAMMAEKEDRMSV